LEIFSANCALRHFRALRISAWYLSAVKYVTVPVRVNVMAPARTAVVPVVRMTVGVQHFELWSVMDDEQRDEN